MRLGEADRNRVAEAIRAAEAETDGEIAVIAAARSDSYHDAALQWSLLAALATGALLAWKPDWLVTIRALPDRGWSGAYALGGLVLTLLLLVTAAFLLARLALGVPAVRMALVPGATRTRRVRRRAVELFRVGTERRTATRTGVLVYLSLAERRAEIVADAAIHAKVPAERWGEAMAALIAGLKADRPGDGIADAVALVGVVLKEVMPHTGQDPNELPDRVIEL